MSNKDTIYLLSCFQFFPGPDHIFSPPPSFLWRAHITHSLPVITLLTSGDWRNAAADSASYFPGFTQFSPFQVKYFKIVCYTLAQSSVYCDWQVCVLIFNVFSHEQNSAGVSCQKSENGDSLSSVLTHSTDTCTAWSVVAVHCICRLRSSACQCHQVTPALGTVSLTLVAGVFAKDTQTQSNAAKLLNLTFSVRPNANYVELNNLDLLCFHRAG